MASSVKKRDIKELREAGYLAKEIVHRLPAKGKIIPTPEPHERVCSSRILSAGWDSLSTHLSAD